MEILLNSVGHGQPISSTLSTMVSGYLRNQFDDLLDVIYFRREQTIW